MNGISVLVVNFNGQRFLQALFESLAQQTLPPAEVIMVDNASSDQSVAYTRQNFPWVHVVPLANNIGFAEGNNIAAKYANGKYLALLNNDTVVDRCWLAELATVLESDDHIGAVVSKILLNTPKPMIDCAGAEFNNIGFCWGRGSYQTDHGQFESKTQVPALTACAMLLRRTALNETPVFNSRLFMYYEEFDLSLRVRGHGYKIFYVPSAIVHHKRSQAVQGITNRPVLFQQYYGNRNRMLILFKYYPLSVLIRNLPLIVLSFGYWNSVFLLQAGLRFFLRAVISQVIYGFHGLAERKQGHSMSADSWLEWMTQQGLSDILALKTTFEQGVHTVLRES